MPSLIISSYDGKTVVAPIEPTPEMLEGAEEFASLEEATQAVTEVLSEAQTMEGGEAPVPAEAEAPPVDPAAPPPPSEEDEDAQMMAGYKSGRRGG